MPVIPFDQSKGTSLVEAPHIDARSLEMIKIGLDHLTRLRDRETDHLCKNGLDAVVELLGLVVTRQTPPAGAA